MAELRSSIINGSLEIFGTDPEKDFSLSVAGLSNLEELNVSGNIEVGGSLEIDGEIKATTITTTTMNSSGVITANGGITATTMTSSGGITTTTMTSSGVITANGGITATAITASGEITANSFNATSSIKAKENIKDCEISALDILSEVKIVEFNFKKQKEKKIGFIAENTNSLLSTKKQDKMDISNSIGLLIKSIQELNEKMEKKNG